MTRKTVTKEETSGEKNGFTTGKPMHQHVKNLIGALTMKGRRQQQDTQSPSSPISTLSTATTTTTIPSVKAGEEENLSAIHESSIPMKEVSYRGSIEEENMTKGLSNINPSLSRGKRTTLPKQSQNVLITSSPMRTSATRKSSVLTAIRNLHPEQPHQEQQQQQTYQQDRQFETISTSETRTDEIQTSSSSRRSDGTLDLKFEKSMRLDSEKVEISSSVLKTGLERCQTLPLIHDMDSHVTCELISSDTLTENNDEPRPDQGILFSPAFTLHGHTLGKREKAQIFDGGRILDTHEWMTDRSVQENTCSNEILMNYFSYYRGFP
jgi:hypothetical protein